VNGDGLADLVVTARHTAYVVFGRRQLGALDVDRLGSGGFRIDNAGDNAAIVGDVNGDGRADVVVSRPDRRVRGWDPQPRSAAVIFGKADAKPVDLGRPGDGGLVIDRIPTPRTVAVGPAGDVNGDGLADVLVGMWTEGLDPRPFVHYVVLGRRLPGRVSLRGSNSGVRRVRTEYGTTPVAVGDVDGDGMGELLLTANIGDCGIDFSCGGARLAYGRRRAATVDARRSRDGRTITSGDWVEVGNWIGSAGDFNGDGLADVGVDAVDYSSEFPRLALIAPGRSRRRIVLGEDRPMATTVRDDLHTVSEGDALRFASLGDIDGDGRDDLLVSSDSLGAAFLVFGRPAAAWLDLSALGPPAVRAARGWWLEHVTGVGDVNGDDVPDALVCAFTKRKRRVVLLLGLRAGGTVDLGAPGPYALTSGAAPVGCPRDPLL
jgi:hypothetical protein